MKVDFTQKAAVAQRRKFLRRGPITKKGVIALCCVGAVVFGIAGYLISSYLGDQKRERLIGEIADYELITRDNSSEVDPSDDTDLDGVINGKEQSIKTSIDEMDTDKDGLSDGDELRFSTDPLVADTDGDSLLDGYELLASLDPLKTSSDGSTADKDKTVNVVRSCDGAVLTLTGTANNNAAGITKLDLVGFSVNSGVLSSAYQVYAPYTFAEGSLAIAADFATLADDGVKSGDVAIFLFDSNTKKYTELPSTADTKGGRVTAAITKSGTYLLGVKSVISQKPITRVRFLIDNSGSMYPKEVLSDSYENDVDFKRLDFAENLIAKFDTDWQIGISKFTADYTELTGFTKDRDKLQNALDSIRNGDENFTGTYIERSIESCIADFTADGKKYCNILVVLTDGESTDDYAPTISDVAKKAEDAGVVILTVSLGHHIDRALLSGIADSTGGKYYTASDADALEQVYQQIMTTLNYEIVDGESTSSIKTAGYMLCNTGFNPSLNGFSFNNLRVTGGDSLSFGMAVFARDYYTGNLSLSLGENQGSGDAHVAGYDLTGTKIAKNYDDNQPLIDFYAAAASAQSFTNCRQYLDFTGGGNKLSVDGDTLDDAKSKGWSTKSYLLNDKTLPWTSVEFLFLDIVNNTDKIASAYSGDELKFYQSLYRLSANKVTTESYNLTRGQDTFDRLVKQLQKGVPAVVTLGGYRTVNVISLRQDVDLPNRYILEVYDNYYYGATREVIIERSTMGVFNNGVANGIDSIYSATYENEQVAFVLSAE
ncbi:MAG: VWA domain-containing protein [Oscillospiraceae bacterium]